MFNIFRKKSFKIENLAKDILNKVETDFLNEKDNAIEILNSALDETDYLRSERTIRCIIYLADKDINKLRKSIQDAKNDPRDVMYWAEYIKRNSLEQAQRVRDFNKQFDKNDLTIKE